MQSEQCMNSSPPKNIYINEWFESLQAKGLISAEQYAELSSARMPFSFLPSLTAIPNKPRAVLI